MMRERVVLVTGGSSGIGRATAIGFAREGAIVAIVSRGASRGREAVAELRRISGRGEFFEANVADATQVERVIRSIVDQFGRLDVAVNNAGAIDVGVFKATADYVADEFDAHIAINLRSVWACMKYEIAQMIQQSGGGAIVNVSSVNGLGGVPQNSLYAAAKAGVLALTKSAALEYAAQKVRVNALVAGAFRTPMLEGVFNRVSPEAPAAVEESYANTVPLRRIGNPEEAAAAIMWLASDNASYVTGH